MESEALPHFIQARELIDVGAIETVRQKVFDSVLEGLAGMEKSSHLAHFRPFEHL